MRGGRVRNSSTLRRRAPDPWVHHRDVICQTRTRNAAEAGLGTPPEPMPHPRRSGPPYQHHLQWGDDNGSSHVRAAMLSPSISIPFEGGSLCVGTWQQIVLIEFDTRGRNRR